MESKSEVLARSKVIIDRTQWVIRSNQEVLDVWQWTIRILNSIWRSLQKISIHLEVLLVTSNLLLLLHLTFCIVYNRLFGDRVEAFALSRKIRTQAPQSRANNWCEPAATTPFQSTDGGQTWQDISHSLRKMNSWKFFRGDSNLYLRVNNSMYAVKKSKLLGGERNRSRPRSASIAFNRSE